MPCSSISTSDETCNINFQGVLIKILYFWNQETRVLYLSYAEKKDCQQKNRTQSHWKEADYCNVWRCWSDPIAQLALLSKKVSGMWYWVRVLSLFIICVAQLPNSPTGFVCVMVVCTSLYLKKETRKRQRVEKKKRPTILGHRVCWVRITTILSKKENYAFGKMPKKHSCILPK